MLVAVYALDPHLAAWPLGRLAAWPLGRLAAWPLGRLAAWPLGRLAAWPLLAAAAIPLLILTVPAGAQTGREETLEEVVITGSRIRRAEFSSNAPVATVDAEQLELTNTINTENLLNTLPQTVPGLDRTSNNPGNGTASVDLRGLGATRTLVLVNGRRVVPTTSGGQVDINNIPNSLIESIEIITGGASAVYGSDAISGVVNFILKDDFEGAEFSSSYEVTEEGDAGLFSFDVTVGGNFADGRGNAVLNVAYTDREDLFQGDRDFSTFAQFDNTDANGNPILIDGGSSGIPATSIFAGGLGSFSPDSFGILFNQDGSIRPFRSGRDNNDFYNYAPVNYIQLPQERLQISGMSHFKANDKLEVYADVFYTSSKVPQQLAPTPIFQNTKFTLDGNPFITPEAQRILSDAIGDDVDTDGDGIADTASALVRRRLVEVGPRIAQSDFMSAQITFGVRGEIGASDWNYDVYLSEGRVTNNETQFGNVNRTRFNQALLLNLSDPANPRCSDPSSNGATVGCTPLNIFGAGNISKDAAAFLRTAVSAVADFDMTVAQANIDGSLQGLEAGDIGIAFGYEFRENAFDFRPSQDLAAGTIAGFNGAPPISGRFNVNEIYVEALVPLIADKNFARAVELELAYRYSDYSISGGNDTYKIAGSWAINDMFRFRGGYNVAVRAPNIGELFAPVSEGFPSGVDPCAGESAPISDAVRSICQATGVPADVIGTPAINPAAGQVRGLFGGNANLDPEEAETYTVGVVVDATAELSFSIDYFDIEITDYIATPGTANEVLRLCYDPARGGAGSTFCNLIARRPDGTIDGISLTTGNVAAQTLKGVDLIGSYSADLWGGLATVRYVATHTMESEFSSANVTDCAGLFGSSICGEPLPEYVHRMTFGWSNERWNAQLLWRMIGSTDDDNDAVVYVVEKLDDEHYFDLSANYTISDNYTLSAGVDNLFDTEPPIIGGNQEQANTYPATYDVFGRTWFVGLRASF